MEQNYLEEGLSLNNVSPQLKKKFNESEQPESYLNKMTYVEKNPLLNCFADQKDLKLTKQNLKLFYSLVSESDILFSSENNEHVKILAEVYRLTFKFEPKDAEELLNSNFWRDFGFQTNKPETDFRGGGLLSLKAMQYMAEYEPDFVASALNFMKVTDSYLHACVVITVVFQLKNFLHFGLFSAYHEKYDAEKACSRQTLKFMLDLEDCKHVGIYLKNFFKLVTAITQRIMGFWKKSIEIDPRVKIIDFKQAETIVFKMAFQVIEKQALIEKVPSYKTENLVEQILCAKITEHIVPMITN